MQPYSGEWVPLANEIEAHPTKIPIKNWENRISLKYANEKKEDNYEYESSERASHWCLHLNCILRCLLVTGLNICQSSWHCAVDFCECKLFGGVLVPKLTRLQIQTHLKPAANVAVGWWAKKGVRSKSGKCSVLCHSNYLVKANYNLHYVIDKLCLLALLLRHTILPSLFLFRTVRKFTHIFHCSLKFMESLYMIPDWSF